MSDHILGKAQKALLRAVNGSATIADLHVINEALSVGCRVADAWQEIDAWMSLPAHDEPAHELNLIRYGATLKLELMPAPWDEMEGSNLLELLERAAELCRAERPL